MRNLKKLLAVIMAVAMLASIMVPALAADYDDDAQKLYNLGLFKGSSADSYQPDLDGTLTREQGLTLMIRAMGMEDEVEAMSEAEINEQLAKVVDVDEIADWARPYVAYAVKNNLTAGIDKNILPNIKFGAKLPLTGKEFITFMLKAMGYPEVAWEEVLTKAAEVGMLTAGEAVNFGSIDVLTRDGAVGIMAKAMGGTTAAGITLAQALVEAGVVTEEDMVEAGYMDPIVTPTPEPEELTAEAYADNLIQAYVVFSQEVDKDSAEDVDNYSITDSEIDNASLQDDGVTVVLTLKENRAQQDVADLTIKNVKDINGTAIDETTIEVEFFDKDIPTILDASIAGKNTFKLVFSEPMNDDEDFVDLDGINVTNESGAKIYVQGIEFQNNNTEALIRMYSDFKEETLTLQVNSKTVEDYAGFSVIGRVFELMVTPDEEAPEVIGYEKAKRGEVTLIWNEDIELIGTLNADGELTKASDPDAIKNFYHTNSKNPASKVTKEGNKMTISFDKDEWLPAGTAYVYVIEEAVKDLWDNENAQQMIKIEVELDEDAPEIDSIEVKDEDVIEVKFTEKLDEESAEDEDNYKVLKDGKEEENIIESIVYDLDKKVTITFYDDLSGDYVLVVKDVKDIYGNKMPSTEVGFFVGDETDPDFADFEAVVYNPGDEGQMLKVIFGEKMATEGKYAVNDLEKYFINDEALADIDDVKIKVVDNGEAVEITIPHGADGLDIAANNELIISRVADAAGNYTKQLSSHYTEGAYSGIFIKVSSVITVDTAEATGVKTVKVKFSDNVAKLDTRDISVVDEVYDPIRIAQISVGLDKGKTVVTITLSEEMDYDLADPVFVKISGVIKNEVEVSRSENVYGDKLKIGVTKLEDKIAPKVDEINFYNAGNLGAYEEFADDSAADSIIVLTYTEALDTTGNVSNYAQDLIIKNKDGDVLVAEEDYKTFVVNDNELVVVIYDVSNLKKYSIESKSSITYIKDASKHNNKAETFKRERNS